MTHIKCQGFRIDNKKAIMSMAFLFTAAMNFVY